jgi:hypothetical protein
MRRWSGRLRRMTASDYRTALDTLLLAVCVEIALRVMPFSRLLHRLRRGQSDSAAVAHDASAEREYLRLRRFVAVAYEILPFPATCLRRSLVLYGLLERRGVPSRFCVGVAKDGSGLAAHAWIDGDGVAHDAAAIAVSELRALPVSPRL